MLETAFNPCVIIPCYNHGKTLDKVLQIIETFGLDCIIVDDGSDLSTKQAIDHVMQRFSFCQLITLPQNQGKGAAVIQGIRHAAQEHYTHALQVDADGQHDLHDIPTFLNEAQTHPTALISGQPIYDHSVPKSRLYGRYITHVWVWIETLSFDIKDSMCGFRVYPVQSTLNVINNTPTLSKRMDFDTDIMVRLYWNGVPCRFIPTKVLYPEEGISHFDTLKDNLRISKMHTKLVIGMLLSLPKKLFSKKSDATHWAKTQERRGLWGMRFMFWLYKHFGRLPFEGVLFFVALWFWLTGGQQSKASRQYIERLTQYAQEKNIALPYTFNSFDHFKRFGQSILDKMSSWTGQWQWGRDIRFAPGAVPALGMHEEKGKLIIGSHLGDLEVCRALAQLGKIKKVTALVFHDHAVRFHQALNEVAPNADIDLLQVDQMTPAVAVALQEKIEQGTWIAIVGDRIALGSSQEDDHRVTWSSFLGKPAPFPQGPFILAALLQCTTVLMFALKRKGILHVYAEPFADPVVLPRKSRQEALQSYIDQFAQRLEHYTLIEPLDWFNFYDFWSLPNDKRK